MAKKLVLISLISLMIGFADEYLVRVELTEDRLRPLFDKGIKVIGELENSAIILMDNSDFDKVSSQSYRILDRELEDGSYYLVRPLDSQIDLRNYGRILTKDGNDFLLKVEPNMLEPLIREKVMVKRLLLTAIIPQNESVYRQVLYDFTVQNIVDLVEPDSVLSHVQRLQDFVSRFSTFDSCFAAADYIATKFYDYGCDSVFFQDHAVDHAPNVIGIKRGELYPDSIYTVVCGHFDSISDQAPWIAPGADDNASGTASVIEAARVMKDYGFEYSVRYIAFSGEEFGLYGSEYYAARARAQADSILGVFNADMIGYVNSYPESVDVVAKISNPACGPLADFFIAAADTYTTLLTLKKMVDWAPYSDHAPFWDNGYVALLNIEDDFPVNPHYHSTSDTIGAGYNDNDFCTEVTKAQVAALSIMAVPYNTGIDEFSHVVAQGMRLGVNPTIGSTHFTISFVIAEPNTKNSLTIYNATGRMIKQWDHTTIQQSNHISWDGTDNAGKKLPAGIYFVQLGNDESRENEKLILLR